MKIFNLRIKNFRCLHDIDIPFENLTALVGRNGTGKSSVLKAIDIFYNINSPVSFDDFCNECTEEDIEITIHFDDLTPVENEFFSSYISLNKLIVTKRITWDNGQVTQQYYAKSLQIPDFAEIRELPGLNNIQRAIRELINAGTYDGLSGTFRSAAQGLEILKSYEDEHPELTELVESRFQFMGARNVGGGSLDNFTRFVLLPAVKEASEEVEGRNTPISQLIDAIVTTEIRSRQELIDFTTDINRQVTERYSPERLGGLDPIAGEISDLLNLYAPNSELKIEWGNVSPIQISLPSVSYSLIEDDYEGDIAKKGHGLQRALILTLIEYLAKRSPEVEGEERTRVDLILAIEEPEIYLHPARCRYLANVLSKLSIRGELDPGENRTQIIYSTHSPYFVGLDRFDSIRILQKRRDADIGLAITTGSYYTLDEASSVYANVSSKRREDVSRENFRIRSVPIMMPLTNEGFFSDLVILVEGPSDVGVLWKLQEIMEKEWEKRSISIIPVGGKQQLLKALIIFRGLGIPTYTYFDLDADDPTTFFLLSCLGQPARYPEDLIHETWACNELTLEDTLKRRLGEENYNQIWIEVGTDFECNPRRLRKNEEALSKFTEIVYEIGMQLDEFEQIVEAITSYYYRISGF